MADNFKRLDSHLQQMNLYQKMKFQHLRRLTLNPRMETCHEQLKNTILMIGTETNEVIIQV